MKIEDKINDTIKKSWKIFVKQYVSLTLGTLVAMLFMIFVITIPPLIFGIYYITIQAMKGKTVKISDVFKGFDYFFTSWGLFLTAAILVILGLALLIIPGILLMILFQYAIPIAIMEKKGPIDSLKKSYNIGKKNFSFSIMLWVIVTIMHTLGGLTKVGVLIACPFAALCVVVATNKIKK